MRAFRGERRGPNREPACLGPAVAGVDTLVTTVNAIGRILAGATDLTIAAVDGEGTLNLIRAAEQAGVRRFVYLSAGGIGAEGARFGPLMAHRYVAIDDVAALRARVAVAEDPPTVVEFGGPEPLSRMEVVAYFEQDMGKKPKVTHVLRLGLAIGHVALGRLKPELASLMGMSLYSDTHPSTWDYTPLRDAGIAPRSATAFIAQSTAPAR
jgi:nucleoside-diphosphate-sugar epimerase